MPAALFILLISLPHLFWSVEEAPVLHYEVREARGNAQAPLILLLHGLGSNEKDLMAFAGQIPGKYLVIAPRAPITIREGSYAWFNVNYAGREKSIDTNEVERSRRLLVEFIGQVKRKYRVDEKQVYLCGFSQGGIMSYGVGLTQPELLKGIGVLSGRMLPSFRQRVTAESLKRLKIFVAHGVSDQVISIKEARQALAYLKAQKLTIDYREYEAGHYVSPGMLSDLLKWLEK